MLVSYCSFRFKQEIQHHGTSTRRRTRMLACLPACIPAVPRQATHDQTVRAPGISRGVTVASPPCINWQAGEVEMWG